MKKNALDMENALQTLLGVVPYTDMSLSELREERLKKYEDIFFTEDGTERITLKDLQAMAALPSNEPLTLEELREMDGEPVWVEFPKCPEASGWMLISASRHCVYNGLLGDCDFENCGRNWLACRRRPEALGGEAAPTLSRPKVGPREGKT